MTSSEENSFENDWRNAFDNAAETPPPSVWERIEARLDEEEERVVVIPLWQRWQTLKWVAAASVTVLLVSIGGWWLSQNNPDPISPLAHQESYKKAPKQASASSVRPLVQKEVIAKATNKAQNPLEKEVPIFSSDSPIDNKNTQNNLPSKKQTSVASTTQNALALASIQEPSQKPSATPTTQALPLNNAINTVQSLSIPNSNADRFQKPVSVDLTTPNVTTFASEQGQQLSLPLSNPEVNTSLIAIKSLDSKQMRELIGMAKRQPWVPSYQTEPSEAKVQQTMPKEYWASVGVMPGSYNAGIAIGASGSQSNRMLASASPSFNNSSSSNSNSNRPSFSYAFQWQGGVQLAQRWSLETGLNYLQGNSVFEGTNGFNLFSNSYINNLEEAVNLGENSNPRYDFAASITDKAQIPSLSTPQSINNSYQFLQVPVQAGYALVKPKRRFSLWLLGGFINNIFLRNSFQNGQENTVTLSGSDTPYRALSFSASTGMRLQYKINKRLATLLLGNYQHALTSTTRSGAAFQARPQLFGVGAGLRYGF